MALDRGDMVWINLDWRARRAELVARLPQATTHEVLEKLRLLLSG